jgi:hypothetical protein
MLAKPIFDPTLENISMDRRLGRVPLWRRFSSIYDEKGSKEPTNNNGENEYTTPCLGFIPPPSQAGGGRHYGGRQ